MSGHVQADEPAAHGHGHSHGHGHRHGHGHGHGHVHGTIDPSILRSRAGVRAVLISLGVLGLTAVVQALVFVLSGSVALLADLIHNAGDALTALPVGLAFLLRSVRAERWAGYAVVFAIFASACVALYETVHRLIDPRDLDHLWALAAAGAVGYLGNEVAARVRLRAGRKLDSAALIADGQHARVDAFVSLGVIASAAVVALGLELADPLIGLAITLVILRITWDSWNTVRGELRLDRTADGIVIRDAARYDRRMRSRTGDREDAFREELVDLAGIEPGEDVVDVGCGTGSLALAAKRRAGAGGTVRGVDPSPEMVDRAARKASRTGFEVEFVKGIAQELPFADESADVVLASLVLHELPEAGRQRAFAEARRVLRPDGRLLVVELDQAAGTDCRAPHSHGHFDLDAVLEQVCAAGFVQRESNAVRFRLRDFEQLRAVLFTVGES